ncbi:hypothetical protein J6590_033252 [Homalodisca vitripennis]|nr:hypothetical protein J6590_033252 [Homalodisca vitripennis]
MLFLIAQTVAFSSHQLTSYSLAFLYRLEAAAQLLFFYVLCRLRGGLSGGGIGFTAFFGSSVIKDSSLEPPKAMSLHVFTRAFRLGSKQREETTNRNLSGQEEFYCDTHTTHDLSVSSIYRIPHQGCTSCQPSHGLWLSTTRWRNAVISGAYVCDAGAGVQRISVPGAGIPRVQVEVTTSGLGTMEHLTSADGRQQGR